MQNIEEQEREQAEEKKKKTSARMDLVELLAEELVQDDELDKVKLLKGVEEEISKFQEKIKETIDTLQKNVI